MCVDDVIGQWQWTENCFAVHDVFEVGFAEELGCWAVGMRVEDEGVAAAEDYGYVVLLGALGSQAYGAVCTDEEGAAVALTGEGFDVVALQGAEVVKICLVG